MRKIAIINQKGGVGKTTTAVNLCAALADTHQRVCLIDLDPQAHATLHLGVLPEDNPSRSEAASRVVTVYDVLTRDVTLAAARRQIADHLWLVPADIDLAAAEVELAGVVGRELIVRDKLADDAETFDYLFIDCPPSLGVLTLNALAAVDEVFIPLQPHFLALHGLSKLLETIDLVSRRLNSRLKISGVILCMYDSATRLAAEVSRDVDAFFQQARSQRSPWAETRIYQTRIRRNVRLAEAPSFGRSIFDYAPDSSGAADYRALAGEFLERAATATHQASA